MPTRPMPPLPPDPAAPDKPELREVRIGVMPLTDAASIVMAPVLGFDRRHGVRIVPVRQASWAGLRDKLLSGELDMGQALIGMLYGIQLGIAGPQRDMALLMTLSRNGQAITLSRSLAQRGVVDGASLARHVRAGGRRLTFAQTFPTGTHAMWLHHWLASHGIDPLRDVDAITVPPPQMVAHLRGSRLDGFCAGEPWNELAVAESAGITVATSQQVWPDHPEKVLAATAGFTTGHANTARAVIAAILETSRWIDAGPRHRRRTAEALAHKAWLDLPVEVIEPRLLGQYRDGLGRSWIDPHRLRFFDDGAVNFPWLSDGMWFLTQFQRWGLLRGPVDHLAIADTLHRIALYREAAASVQVSLPTHAMRASTLSGGLRWDGSDPAAHAAQWPCDQPPASLAKMESCA